MNMTHRSLYKSIVFCAFSLPFLLHSTPTIGDGLFGGAGSNPLGALFGKQSDDNTGNNSGNSGGLFGSVLSGVSNTSLGPVGLHLLGRELAARLVGANEVAPFNDPRVEYVRAITLTLVRESLRPYEYKDHSIFVIKNDSSVNAHAAPGGFIFVTSGLLNYVENEDELAFVVAHEVAHVELDHGLNAIKQAAGQTLAIGSFGFSDELNKKLSDGFSEDIEGEADFRAGQMLARAGYDASLGAKIIERLENRPGRTHATGYPRDRFTSVIKGVRQAGGPRGKSSSSRTQRFKAALR